MIATALLPTSPVVMQTHNRLIASQTGQVSSPEQADSSWSVRSLQTDSTVDKYLRYICSNSGADSQSASISYSADIKCE